MLRMKRHQVVAISEHTDHHVFRRFDRLFKVRRFIGAWMALVLLLLGSSAAQMYSLSNYYQTLQPARGGMYTEGVVGVFSNANPIYASSVADRTVSRLVFSGLLTHDQHNQLTGDLAEKWSADARGQVYTVTLRPDLKWHDGKPLTSEDVVFTYNVIQNPDTQSPLNSSWQNVEVKAVDARTVTFTLSNPLASFPQSMTNGIIPKHVLGETPMAGMRTSSFNTANPIGSGPFSWQDVSVVGTNTENRQEIVTLQGNPMYHHGKPKLDNFSVHTFRNADLMIKSYDQHELQAMVGLQEEPNGTDAQVNQHVYTQAAALMTFFKVTAAPLTDVAVRKALVSAADTGVVRKQLGRPSVAVNAPILKGQVGYDSSVTQLAHNKAEADALLAGAGWTLVKGVRTKDGQPLKFTLTTEDTPENVRIAKSLQQQWKAVGVQVDLSLQSAAELQISLATHDYQALLRGISLGGDPDSFVYWHSTQADMTARGGRLNFSEYKSKVADEALELGRTRTDASLRAAKYKPFLESWRNEAPAFGLYQPQFLYITRQTVYGLDPHTINNASDRLNNVHEWMVRLVKTTVE